MPCRLPRVRSSAVFLEENGARLLLFTLTAKPRTDYSKLVVVHVQLLQVRRAAAAPAPRHA